MPTMTGLTGSGVQLVPADVGLNGVGVNLLQTDVTLPGTGTNLPGPSGGFDGQLNLDLVNNTGNVTPATALTTTRAGAANVQNTSGGLTSIPANTLRIGADEVFNQLTGVWIEEAVTNGVSSPDFSGAVAGTTTLPTGWSRPAYDASGLTTTVAAVSATTIDIAITGTAAGGNYFAIEMGTPVTAAVAQRWTTSLMFQVVSGTLTNLTGIGPAIIEYSGGSFAGAFTIDPVQIPQTDIPWFAQSNRTLTTGNQVKPAIAVQVGSGAVNATIRIQRPQIAQQSFRSTFGTRAADSIALASSYQTAYAAAASRSVCLGFDAPRVSGNGTLWSEYLDANNLIELRTATTNASTAISLFVRSGGVTTANTVLAILPPLSRNKIAVSITNTGITTQVNGDPALLTSLTPPTGLTTVNLGSGQNGYLNSTVQTLQTWLRALTAPELASGSALTTLFDDFNRANSASLGVTPTGFTWSQTGAPVASIASNFMATNGATGATYCMLTYTASMAYMGVSAAYANQPNEASTALVAADTAPTVGVSNGAHIIFTTTILGFQYVAAGTVTPLMNYSFVTPLVKDGTTLSGLAYGLRQFDNSTVGIVPDGNLVRYVNSQITSRTGAVTWYEMASANATPAMPKFRAISGR